MPSQPTKWKRWIVQGRHKNSPELPCLEADQEPATPIPRFFPEWFVPFGWRVPWRGRAAWPIHAFFGIFSPETLWNYGRPSITLENFYGILGNLYRAYTWVPGTPNIGNRCSSFRGKTGPKGEGHNPTRNLSSFEWEIWAQTHWGSFLVSRAFVDCCTAKTCSTGSKLVWFNKPGLSWGERTTNRSLL